VSFPGSGMYDVNTTNPGAQQQQQQQQQQWWQQQQQQTTRAVCRVWPWPVHHSGARPVKLIMTCSSSTSSSSSSSSSLLSYGQLCALDSAFYALYVVEIWPHAVLVALTAASLCYVWLCRAQHISPLGPRHASTLLCQPASCSSDCTDPATCL
jgi:hypothetical protein